MLPKYEQLQVLRLMAWERAKAELSGIGHASDGMDDDKMSRYFELCKAFVTEVEEQNLLD